MLFHCNCMIKGDLYTGFFRALSLWKRVIASVFLAFMPVQNMVTYFNSQFFILHSPFFRQGRRGVAIFKIAAMVAILVMSSTEMYAQYLQGIHNGLDHGWKNAVPLHSTVWGGSSTSPQTIYVNSTNDFSFSMGTPSLVECAIPGVQGATIRMDDIKVGTAGTSFTQRTGSLLTGQTAHQTWWTNASNPALTTYNGAIWLVITWFSGDAPQRYEMKRNSEWQLVPKNGPIAYRYPVTDKPPCSYKIYSIQLQAAFCQTGLNAGTQTCTGPWFQAVFTVGGATNLGTNWSGNLYTIQTPLKDTDVKIQQSAANTSNTYSVCAGDVTYRNFLDQTRFICNGTRYVQFEYTYNKGPGNPPTTGQVTIHQSSGGTQLATLSPGGSRRDGGTLSTGLNTARSANGSGNGIDGTQGTADTQTNFIRLPSDVENGDFVEVKMYSWNACNIPAGFNPASVSDAARSQATVSFAYIRVQKPTDVITERILDFCYPGPGINNNYNITFGVNGSLTNTSTQATNGYRIYVSSNAAGTAPSGTYYTSNTGAAFNPQTATFIPAANRLVPNGTYTERNRTYWVTYVNTAGCESVPTKIVYKVREDISAAPVITGPMTAPVTVCSGHDYTFSVNSTNYPAKVDGFDVTYVWMDDPGGNYTIVNTSGGDNRTGQTATIRFTAAATVRLFRMWTMPVSNSPTGCNTPPVASGQSINCENCFSAQGALSVAINAPPAGILTGGGTICGDVNPMFTINSLTGGTSYNVKVSNGITETTYSGITNGYQFTATQTEGTTVTYTITQITATGNSCVGTGGSNVVVVKRPLLSLEGAIITTEPNPLCESGDFSAKLMRDGLDLYIPSETDLLWSYNSVSSTVSGDNEVYFPSAGDAGSRPITVRWQYHLPTTSGGSNYCPTSLSSQILTVTQAPRATIASSSVSQAICEGSDANVTINLSGGTAGETFEVKWDLHFGSTQIGTTQTITVNTAPGVSSTSHTVTIPASMISLGRGNYFFSLSSVDRGPNSCSGVKPTGEATITVEKMPEVTSLSTNLTNDITCAGIPFQVNVGLIGEPGSSPYTIEYTVKGEPQFPVSAPAGSSSGASFNIPVSYSTVANSPLEIKIISVKQEGGKYCTNTNSTTPLLVTINPVEQADPNIFNASYSRCEQDYSGTAYAIHLEGNLPADYLGKWTIVMGSGGSLIDENSSSTDLESTQAQLFTVEWKIWEKDNSTCYSSKTANVYFAKSTTEAEVFYATDEVCYDMPYELWAVRPTPSETGLWEIWEIEQEDGTKLGKAWWTLVSGSGNLPAGLKLDSATGEITGIPETTTAGTYNFSVNVENFTGEVIIPCTLVILPSGSTPGATGTINDGVVGMPYTYTFTMPSSIAQSPVPAGWGLITDDGNYKTGVQVNIPEYALGIYKFRWSVIGGCGYESDFSTVTFHPKPILKKIPDFTVCAEDIISMPPFVAVKSETDSTPVDDTGFTYRWQFAGNVMTGFNSGWQTDQFPAGRRAPAYYGNAWQYYNVSYEVDNGLCFSDRMNVQIELRPKPRQVELSNGVRPLCSGDETIMRLSNNMWYDTKYNWTISGTDQDFIVNQGNGSYIPYVPADAGPPVVDETVGQYEADDEAPPFSFRFKAKNDGNAPITATINATATVNGCTGDPVFLPITINPKPILTKPADIVYCPQNANGDPVIINATQTTITSSIADTEYTWVWNGINIGFTMPTTVGSEDYTYVNNLGNFQIMDNISTGRLGGTMTVTGETFNCVSEPVSFQMWVKPRPDIRLPIVQPLCPEPGVGGSFPSFTFRSSNLPDDQVDYEWKVEKPDGSDEDGVGSTPTATALEFDDNINGVPDIYSWTVTATGKNTGPADGCVSTLASPLEMTVLPRPVIVINNPNAVAAVDPGVCSGNGGAPFNNITFSTGSITSSFTWNISTPPSNDITTGAASMFGYSSPITFTSPPINISSLSLYETYKATISVNATSLEGCKSDQAETGLYIRQKPVMNTPDPVELCSGGTQPAITLETKGGIIPDLFSWQIVDDELWLEGSGVLTDATEITPFTAVENKTNPAVKLETEIKVWAIHTNGCESDKVSFPFKVRPEIRLTTSLTSPLTYCPDNAVSIPSFTSNVYGADASMIKWSYTSVDDVDISDEKYFTDEEPPYTVGKTGNGNIPYFYTAPNTGSPVEGKFKIIVGSHWSETRQDCASDPVYLTIMVNPTPPTPSYSPDIDATKIDDVLYYCNDTEDTVIDFSSVISDATFSWESSDNSLTGAYTGTGNLLHIVPINRTTLQLFDHSAVIQVKAHAGDIVACPSLSRVFEIIVRPVAQVFEGYDGLIAGCSDTEFTIPKFSHHTLFSPSGYDPSDDPDPIVYNWSFTALDNDPPSWTDDPDVDLDLVLDATSSINPIAKFKPHITGNEQRSLMLEVIPKYEGCDGVKKEIIININPTPIITLQNADEDPYDDFERCSDGEPFSDIYLHSTLPLSRGFQWNLEPYTTADETQYTDNGATSGITYEPQNAMAATFGNHRPHNSHVKQYKEVFRFVTSPTALVGGCKAQLEGDNIFIINQAPDWAAVNNVIACSEEIIDIPAFTISNVAQIGTTTYTWKTNNSTVWYDEDDDENTPPDWEGLEDDGTLNASALKFPTFKTTRNNNLTDNTATVTLKAQITGGCASEKSFTVAVKTFPVIENFPVDAKGLREDAFCFGETVANASFITNVYGVTHTNVSWKIDPASQDIFGGAYGATPFDGTTRAGNISFAAGNTTNANSMTATTPLARAPQKATISIWVDDKRNHANLYNGLGYCRSDLSEWEITVNPTPEIIQTGTAIASPYCPIVDAIPAQTFSTNPALKTGDYIEWRSVGTVGNANSARTDGDGTLTTLGFGGFNAVNTGFTNATATVTVTVGVGAKTNGTLCEATKTLPVITVKPKPQLSPGYITAAQVCSGEEMNLTPFPLHPGFTGQPGWDDRQKFEWTRVTPIPNWFEDDTVIDQSVPSGYLPAENGTADKNSTVAFALPMFKPVIKDANRHSFTLRVKPELDGCYGDEHDVEITINPTPKVSVEGDLLVCSGSSFGGVTLKTAGNVPVNWSWTLDPQGGPYAVPNIPTTGATTQTGIGANIGFNSNADSRNNTVYREKILLGTSPDYKITSTAAWGSCAAVLDKEYFLTVLQTPAINALPSVVICSNADHSAITLGTSNVSAPTTVAYSWTITNADVWDVTASSGAQIPAFKAKPYVSTGTPPLASTDVNSASVTVTAGIDHSAAYPAMTASCTSAQSFTIQVKPLPEIRSSLAEQTVCAGDIVTGVPFVTNVTGSNNPEYVNWTIRNDLVTPSISDNIFATGSGAAYVVGGAGTGNISFPSTATGSMKTAYFDLRVRMPYTDLTHWSTGASSTNKYCESDLKTLKINVNPTPVISHDPLFDQPGPPAVTGLLKDAYCHNDWTSAANITFTVSPSPAATDEFRWDRTNGNVGGTASQVASGASLTFPRFQVQNSTSPASLQSRTANYTVSAAVGSRINAYNNVNNGNACTVSETFSIVVKPRPELAPFTSPISQCGGETFTSPNIQLHPSFVSHKPSPANTDTKFSWTVTTSNDWFNTSTINVSPATTVFPSDATDQNPVSGGHMGSVSLFTPFTPFIAGADPQYVFINIVPQHDGCTGDPQSLQLTVRPAPMITGINETIVCSGEKFPSINLNGIVSTPSTFQWSFVRGTYIAGQDPGMDNRGVGTAETGAMIEFSRNSFNEQTTAYGGSILTITAKANGADGCTSQPITREFVVLQAPVMSNLLDIQVCSEEEIKNFIPLTLNPPTGSDPLDAIRYEWELTPFQAGVWNPTESGVNVATSGTTWMSDFTAGANNGNTNLSNDIHVFAVAKHSATYNNRECYSRSSSFALIRRPAVYFTAKPANTPPTACHGVEVTLSPNFAANAGATIDWTLNTPSIVDPTSPSLPFDYTQADFPIKFIPVNTTTAGIDGTFTATAQITRTLPAATSGYGIAGMNAFCKSDAETFVLTVNPIPTITVKNADPVCSGADAVIPAFASNITGATFNWRTTQQDKDNIGWTFVGTTGNGNIGTITGVTNGANTLLPATATVETRASANGCFSDWTPFTITVKPIPQMTFSFPNGGVVCSEADVTPDPFTLNTTTWGHYTDAADRATLNFYWSVYENWFAGSGLQTSSPPNQPPLLPAGTPPAFPGGDYVTGHLPTLFTPVLPSNQGITDLRVRIYPEFLGCVGTPITPTLTINPLTVISFANLPDPVCSGDAFTRITVNDVNGVGGLTYGFSLAPINSATGDPTVGTPSVSSNRISFTSSKNTGLLPYEAELVVFANAGTGNCKSSDIKTTLTVYPEPVMTTPDPIDECSGVVFGTVTGYTPTTPYKFSTVDDNQKGFVWSMSGDRVWNLQANLTDQDAVGTDKDELPGFVTFHDGRTGDMNATVSVNALHKTYFTVAHPDGCPSAIETFTFKVRLAPTITLPLITPLCPEMDVNLTPVTITSNGIPNGQITLHWESVTGENISDDFAGTPKPSGTGQIPPFTTLDIKDVPSFVQGRFSIWATREYETGKFCSTSPGTLNVGLNPAPAKPIPVNVENKWEWCPENADYPSTVPSISFTPVNANVIYTWQQTNSVTVGLPSGSIDRNKPIPAFSPRHSPSVQNDASIAEFLVTAKDNTTTCTNTETFSITILPVPQMISLDPVEVCGGEVFNFVNEDFVFKMNEDLVNNYPGTENYEWRISSGWIPQSDFPKPTTSPVTVQTGNITGWTSPSGIVGGFQSDIDKTHFTTPEQTSNPLWSDASAPRSIPMIMMVRPIYAGCRGIEVPISISLNPLPITTLPVDYDHCIGARDPIKTFFANGGNRRMQTEYDWKIYDDKGVQVVSGLPEIISTPADNYALIEFIDDGSLWRGTLTLQETNWLECKGEIVSMPLSMLPFPILDVLPENRVVEVCYNAEEQLHAYFKNDSQLDLLNPATTIDYKWSPMPLIIDRPGNFTTLDPWIRSSSNQIFRVTVEVNKCISNEATIEVKVHDQIISPRVPAVVVCESDQQMTMIAYGVETGNTVYWERVEELSSGMSNIIPITTGNGMTDINMNDRPTHPNGLPTSFWTGLETETTIFYQIYQTAPIGHLICNSDPVKAQLKINRTPAPPDNNVFTYCEDTGNQLYELYTGTTETNVVSYNWYRPEDDPHSDMPYRTGYLIRVSQPGNSKQPDGSMKSFDYKVTTRSTANCPSEATTIPLFVYPNPELSFQFEDRAGNIIDPTNGLCSPHRLIGRNTSPSHDANYEWRWAAGISDPAPLNDTTGHVYRVDGTISEMIRLNLYGASTVYKNSETGVYCSSEKEQMIVVNPGVTADFITISGEACHPMNVLFTSTSSNAYNFRWYWNTPTPPDFIPGKPVIPQPNPNPGGYQGIVGPNPSYDFVNTTPDPLDYHIWLQVDNGVCFNNKDTVITIYPVPFASFSNNLIGDNSVCPPTPIIFTNNSEGPKYANNAQTEYIWEWGDGYRDITLIDQPQVIHSYENWTSSVPIPYRVRLYANNTYTMSNGKSLICTSKEPAFNDLYVNPQVEARFTGPVEGCSPMIDAWFQSQSIGLPTSHQWDFGDGTFNTGTNPTHTFRSLSGNHKNIEDYTVKLVAGNSWCKDSVTHDFRLYPQPIASFTVDELSGCQPFKVTFTNNSNSVGSGNPSDGMSYHFDYSDGYWDSFDESGYSTNITNVDNSDVLNNFNNRDEVSHIFTNVMGSDIVMNPMLIVTKDWTTSSNETLSCVSERFTQRITVFPFLKAQFALSDTVGCSPFNVTLWNGSSGYLNYEYTFSNGITQPIIEPGDQGSGQIIEHIFEALNMYEDIVYDITLSVISGHSCTDTQSRQVYVRSKPRADFRPGSPYPADFPYPAPPIGIENLIQSPDKEKLIYEWSWTNMMTLEKVYFDDTFDPKNLYLNDWGSFGITQHVTSPNLICDDALTRIVNIVPQPAIANFENVTPSCMPYEVQFINTSRFARAYQWNFGDGNISSEQYAKHTFMRADTFNVMLVAFGYSMMPDTIIKKVVVHPIPQAGFEVKPDFLWVGQVVNTKNNTTHTDKNGKEYDVWYRWNWGDHSPEETGENPSHYYLRAGKYDITLTATTNTTPACSTSFTLYNAVELQSAGDIILPNAFKPIASGDPGDDIPTGGNKNYLFYPPVLSPTIKYSLMIYTRWGQLVYQTNDPNKGWNGYFRGKLLDEDVYIYRVEGVFTTGRSFSKTGDVVLIR